MIGADQKDAKQFIYIDICRQKQDSDKRKQNCHLKPPTFLFVECSSLSLPVEVLLIVISSESEERRLGIANLKSYSCSVRRFQNGAIALVSGRGSPKERSSTT